MPFGQIKKIALIAGLTAELERASIGTAAIIIEHVLRIAVGRGLDAALFNSATGDDIRPPGLLFGVTPIAGSADMAKDLSALVASIAAAGVDTSSVAFICSPAQALAVELAAGPHFAHRIIEASSLAAGTVIAIAVGALLVAGSGTPVVDIAKHGTLHLAAPASPISAAGTPDLVSAPVRDLHQTDSFALRCIARLTWAVAPGGAQAINGTTW